MKITLAKPTGGYNLAEINQNFTDLETELQNKVLYRDNPTGEPNTMMVDLDMNSKRVLNLPSPSTANEAARLVDVQAATTTGLPVQTGNANKALKTDGTVATWQTEDALHVSANDGQGGSKYTTVQGFIDITTAAINDEWKESLLAPTFISTTSFSVVGNHLTTLPIGRRVRTSNTGGTVYSTIISSSFNGTITTIGVLNDSGTLDSGITSLYYGLFNSTNPSLPNSQAVKNAMGFGNGVDIASATTIDFTAVTGQLIRITGTVATTSVILNTGQMVVCFPTGAWPLTYHATNMPVQGGISYTCTAGDVVIFMKNGGGQLTVSIFRQDGVAFVQSPLKYAFRASRSANQTSGTTLILDSVLSQIGSSYNNTTGVFTAPVTGWYSFTAGIRYFNNTGGAVATYVTVLTHSVTGSLAQAGSSLSVPNVKAIEHNISTNTYMTAGQTVSITVNPAVTATFYAQVGYTNFSGIYLGT